MPDARERVRFGGDQAGDGYVFELTGGRLCLDFVNTLDERDRERPRELLRSFSNVIDWGLQADALSRDEARSLREHARAHPHAAADALARAITLREHLFDLFSAIAARANAPPTALAALDLAARRGCQSRCLRRSDDRFQWGWRTMSRPDLGRVSSRVAWSAVELLVSSDLPRVRRCEGAGCAWLFLDASKNRTRRWCDMTVCGNRAKARRHYARTRRQPNE